MGCHKIEIALQTFAIRRSSIVKYIRKFVKLYAEIPYKIVIRKEISLVLIQE